MARYVVMQKGDDAGGAVFIRDGFSLPALIVPHLWLAFHRQWLAAITVVSAMVLGVLVAWYFNAQLMAFGFDILISLYVAFEGAMLRVANLERAGFSEAAHLEASNQEEAEIRYFGAMPESTISAARVFGRDAGSSSSNAFAFPARG